MDISIVIVNYNTKALTQNCIQSIFKYVRHVEFEVIVVDNNSSDGSQELLKKAFPQITLIENHKNLGFGKANNQAMLIAQGEFLLLLNSDTCLTEEGIDDIYEFAKNTPDAVIIGGKIYFGDNSLQYSCRRFDNLFSEILMHSICIIKNIDPFSYRNKMMDFDHKSTREVDWVSGAYMLIRKNVLQDNYIFDPKIFMYHEDKDFCRKIKQQGGNVYYFPGSPIYHYHGQSGKDNRSRGNVACFLGSVIYVENHYNKYVAIFYKICVVFFWVCIYLVLTILSSFSKNDKILSKKILFSDMLDSFKKSVR